MDEIEQWFTFNGKSCADFGIVVQSYTDVIRTASRCKYQDIPGCDGSLELVDDSCADVSLVMLCAILCDDEYQLRERSRAVAAWLRGKGDLHMYDDAPGKFRRGRVSNEVAVTNFETWGTFTLQWRCDPFLYGSRRSVPLGVPVFIDGTAPAKGVFNLAVGSEDIKSANVAGMKLSGEMSAGAEIKVDTLHGFIKCNGQQRDGLLSMSSRYLPILPGLIILESDLQGTFDYEPRWY